MSPDESLDDDADLWLNLLSRLQQGQKDAQRLPIRWSYPLDLTIGRESAFHLWARDDIEHKDQISAMIDRWLAHGIVDDSSEELRWSLAARFAAAIDLVGRLTFSKGNLTPDATWRTIFPFPRIPVNQVLRFFLGEWWSFVGSHLFFDEQYDQLSRAAAGK